MADEPDFHVPDEVRAHFAEVKQRGEEAERQWNEHVCRYKAQHPELAAQFETCDAGELPAGWDAELPAYTPEDKAMATRAASGEAMNAIAEELAVAVRGIGRSGIVDEHAYERCCAYSRPDNYGGRNVYFGVREFAMGAAMNGMLLHGGLNRYGGTFFVFSDYLRPAIRLAALMELPAIYVFTHDSIGVGEDGPTHEPIEQLPSLAGDAGRQCHSSG